jgi:hypothetical protein
LRSAGAQSVSAVALARSLIGDSVVQ